MLKTGNRLGFHAVFLIDRDSGTTYLKAENMDCKEEISDSDSGIILHSGKHLKLHCEMLQKLFIYLQNLNSIDGHICMNSVHSIL